MIKQSDVQGRLNLFRYGIVVVTITAFLISLFAPMVLTADLPVSLGIGDLLMPSLVITVGTAIVGAIAYFAYAKFLNSTVGNE
ncbi:MAG: hypothetical protein Phog2KO_27560 [Phototrophicaceae bacterium]